MVLSLVTLLVSTFTHSCYTIIENSSCTTVARYVSEELRQLVPVSRKSNVQPAPQRTVPVLIICFDAETASLTGSSTIIEFCKTLESAGLTQIVYYVVRIFFLALFLNLNAHEVPVDCEITPES